MSRAARLASTLVLAVALAALSAVTAARFAHWSAVPVLTGSMVPTFRPGAVVVTRPVPVQQLHPDQVVVFVPPGARASFAHRIVAIGGDSTSPVLETKGDANPAPDPWRARLSTPTAQVVVLHVPAIGRLGVLLHGPGTHALLIALLGVGLTGTSVRLVLTAPHPAPATP